MTDRGPRSRRSENGIPEGRQLTLGLPHRPATGRADFLVAPSNEVAVAWVDRWPDWPLPGLVLHGPAGCGKSHLAAVWAAAADARHLDRTSLAGAAGADSADLPRTAVIEDAEALFEDDETAQEAAFHLYNRLAEAGGWLLLTARRAPVLWTLALRDLQSRINALPSAAIAPPDDALLEALFVKHFADRQLRVGRDVVAYLVARAERSHEAVRRLVDRLDRQSLADRRTITVPLARAVLGQEDGAGDEGEGP